MNAHRHFLPALRLAPALALSLVVLTQAGCATGRVAYSPQALAANSPRAQKVAPLDAYALAKRFVDAHEGTDYLVGTGQSMMPLYRDHAVLIVRPDPLDDLREGMTVVFVDDRGTRVAHALVRRVRGGWVTMGVGNASCDRVGVTEANYVGVVVKVFEPTGNPMLALVEEDQPAPMEPTATLAMGK